MFAQLIEPLRRDRSIYLDADFAEETAAHYRRPTYLFSDVDVILVEGIFLIKHAYRERYDLTAWIDCSFDTAIYFPAQRNST